MAFRAPVNTMVRPLSRVLSMVPQKTPRCDVVTRTVPLDSVFALLMLLPFKPCAPPVVCLMSSNNAEAYQLRSGGATVASVVSASRRGFSFWSVLTVSVQSRLMLLLVVRALGLGDVQPAPRIRETRRTV